MKNYDLYAEARGGPFTVQSIAYSRGTHRLIYTVRAFSVKQAYYLAGKEDWAPSEHSLGVQQIAGPDGFLVTPQTLAQTGNPKTP